MPSGLNAVGHFVHLQDRPTALFCLNDEMAIAAIQGLKNNGIRVPEDMSVTGFDDIEFAKFSDRPLTTISSRRKNSARLQ